jgi:hypothetical protein
MYPITTLIYIIYIKAVAVYRFDKTNPTPWLLRLNTDQHACICPNNFIAGTKGLLSFMPPYYDSAA